MKAFSHRFGLALCLIASAAHAQITPGKLTFALPTHPGRMTIDQQTWQIEELSAKSNGNEWGERLTQGDQHMLAFLFAAPDKDPLNASACLEGVLKAEHAETSVQNRTVMRSFSGVEIALAVLISPQDSRMSLRAFVASGDVCGDLLFNAGNIQPGDEHAYQSRPNERRLPAKAKER